MVSFIPDQVKPKTKKFVASKLSEHASLRNKNIRLVWLDVKINSQS